MMPPRLPTRVVNHPLPLRVDADFREKSNEGPERTLVLIPDCHGVFENRPCYLQRELKRTSTH